MTDMTISLDRNSDLRAIVSALKMTVEDLRAYSVDAPDTGVPEFVVRKFVKGKYKNASAQSIRNTIIDADVWQLLMVYEKVNKACAAVKKYRQLRNTAGANVTKAIESIDSAITEVASLFAKPVEIASE